VRTTRPSCHFRRDFKREKMTPRGHRLDALVATVTDMLAADMPLSDRRHDHPLGGSFDDFRDCHVHTELVLIYRKPDVYTLELCAPRTRHFPPDDSAQREREGRAVRAAGAWPHNRRGHQRSTERRAHGFCQQQGPAEVAQCRRLDQLVAPTGFRARKDEHLAIPTMACTPEDDGGNWHSFSVRRRCVDVRFSGISTVTDAVWLAMSTWPRRDTRRCSRQPLASALANLPYDPGQTRSRGS
jgi:mRNA interferase YafQ